MSAGLRSLLLVAAGGALGAVARYLMGGLLQRLAPFSSFPWATLSVNVFGCLAIGTLAGLDQGRSPLAPELRMLLWIGLLGGFTTFSSFGYETLALLRQGDTLRALASVAANLLLGLGAVWLGFVLTRVGGST